MGTKCVCCGLDTVGRDYEKGGFSCGNCGIENGSEAWNKIAELRDRVAELEARLSLLPNMPVSSAMRREWERYTLRPFDSAAEEAFRAMLRAALEGKG